MATPNQPASLPEILPPQQPATQTNVTTTAFSQMTQIQAYVPPQVWTTEALLDLHAKQKEVIFKNIESLNEQRNKENRMAIFVLAGFGAVLAVGFWFAYMKIDLGRDIVISAVSAGLGYAAGYGTGLTKRQ
jgi:hypothetical protein